MSLSSSSLGAGGTSTAQQGVNGLNGLPATSRRQNRPSGMHRRAGVVLSRQTTANRFTAWQRDLPFWKRRW